MRWISLQCSELSCPGGIHTGFRDSMVYACRKIATASYSGHNLITFRFFSNKTGTRQCTRGIWSTFADIQCIDVLFGVPGISGYLWYVIYLWINQSLKTPGLSITFGTLLACRSFEAKDYRTISLHSQDFLLLSCLHVRSRNALHNITKYMSSTGIIRNFGRLRDILWNVFLS